MSISKTMVFIDGENLVMRYQGMLKSGYKPRPDVVHVPDTFVWHPQITKWSLFDITRVSYYTSAVGDEPKLQSLKDKIANVGFKFAYIPEDAEVPEAHAQIYPRIFKKSAQSQKTKTVDINIAIDVMRAAHLQSVDLIYLLSGDGDYLPLISEVMRQGKQVYVSAFSLGLHPELNSAVDEFVVLDNWFFSSDGEKTLTLD